MKQLLKSHPSCLSVRDKKGSLPIHLAAKHPAMQTFTYCRDNIATAESVLLGFLVEKLPTSIRCKDARGNLPIHLWFQHERGSSLPLANLLIDAYPDSISQKDEFGRFPVHRVAHKGFDEDFKYLVEKYPECLGLQDAQGNYPIHSFLTKYPRGLPFYVIDILNAHPALLQQEGASGWLPIHLVVKQYDDYPDKLIQTMGELFPGSLLHKDKQGKLPIHFADDKSIETLARLCPKSLRVYFGTSWREFPMVSYLKKYRVPNCRLIRLQEMLEIQYSQPCDEKVKHEIAQLKGRLEVKEQLVNTLKKDSASLQDVINTLKNDKKSLQDEIKDMKVHLDCEQQTTKHARAFEKAFIARLRDSQTDIPTVKSFAVMLKARLDARASAKENSSASKPSWLHRMFPSMVRDPEVSRSVLIDCVEAFDAELTVLETEEGDDDECSNARTSTTEGNTQDQEHGAASELPHPQAEAPGEAVTILAEEQEQRPAKRARVSLP